MHSAPDPSPSAEPRPSSSRRAAGVAVALTALGLVLRLRGVSEYWLNPDEGIYYSTVTQPSFGRFWAEVMANAHPPAYYVLLRMLGLLTWDFVWLRGTALVFGTATVWIFWRIGRELGADRRAGAVAGFVAAALVAVNAEAVTLSQVLRPYTLLVLLLAAGLLQMLRFRATGARAPAIAYSGLLTLAVLTHYSAALALGVLSLLVGHDIVTDRVPRGGARKTLLVAHAVPVCVFAALYVAHLGHALGSDLMGQALDAGGWLSDWLVASPASAWAGLRAYQIFHFPSGYEVLALGGLLAAAVVSALDRDRTVAVLVLGAFATGLTVSALGLYPIGPSRHSAWLTAFTIPALGWLVGRLSEIPGREAVRTWGVLALAVAATWSADLLGSPRAETSRTNATEEKLIRQADLAPLIVERMAPDQGPETVVMSEQSYNTLMPLYAGARREAVAAPGASYLVFPYGRRRILVDLRWDWSDIAEVTDVLRRAAADGSDAGTSVTVPVTVVTGGWGSPLMAHAAELERTGALLEQSWALGRDPSGQPTIRMMAFVLDPSGLR